MTVIDFVELQRKTKIVWQSHRLRAFSFEYILKFNENPVLYCDASEIEKRTEFQRVFLLEKVIPGSSIDIGSSSLHESPQKVSSKSKALPRSRTRAVYGGRSVIARKKRTVGHKMQTNEQGGKKKSFHLQKKNDICEEQVDSGGKPHNTTMASHWLVIDRSTSRLNDASFRENRFAVNAHKNENDEH